MPGIEPRLTMYKAISIPAVLSLIPALTSEKCFSNYAVKGRRTRCSFPMTDFASIGTRGTLLCQTWLCDPLRRLLALFELYHTG